MSIGFYREQDSILHRMHPSVKIVAMFIGFAQTLLISDPLWLLLLGLVYSSLAARAGAFSSLRPVGPILLLVALASLVIWGAARGGERVLFEAGPISFTAEGLLFGGGMGLRLVAMAWLGLIFLSSTSIEQFTHGMVKLGTPYSLAFALSLSFRLVPLFMSSIGDIQDAQRARGLDPAAGGLLGKARSFAPMIVPVFSSALRRADQMAIALEARGFGRGGKRSSYLVLSWGPADIVVSAAMLAILALCVWARLQGLGQAPL